MLVLKRTHVKAPAVTPPVATVTTVTKKEKKSSITKQQPGSPAAVRVAVQQPKAFEETPRPAATAPSGIRLIIRARENCYIQLKTDGHVVFQNVLKKGRFESWSAKEKIEFSLSNAGAVDLEINGRTISNLGRKKQPLKHVIVTKEGLMIP